MRVFLLFLLLSGVVMAEDADRFVKQFRAGTNYCVAISEGESEMRSIGSYTVRLYKVEDSDFPTTWYLSGQIRPRHGSIEEVVFKDVDGDQTPDVVVIIKNAGTGGSLWADAFKINNNNLLLLASTGGLYNNADCVAVLRKKLKAGKGER